MVYSDGTWLIHGSAKASSAEPKGSPNNVTDATPARTYFSDQLYNVWPKIPGPIAMSRMMLRSLVFTDTSGVLNIRHNANRTSAATLYTVSEYTGVEIVLRILLPPRI